MRREAIVAGYHATSKTDEDTILGSQLFRDSDNGYDWLATGIYFWQDAPVRAWKWGREERRPRPYGDQTEVLGAKIVLSVAHCIDFLDIDWEASLREAYEEYMSLVAFGAADPSVQRGGRHGMDHAIIDQLVYLLSGRGKQIHTVRCAFQEGNSMFVGSALYTRSHVQIAVHAEYQTEVIHYIWREPEGG